MRPRHACKRGRAELGRRGRAAVQEAAEVAALLGLGGLAARGHAAQLALNLGRRAWVYLPRARLRRAAAGIALAACCEQFLGDTQSPPVTGLRYMTVTTGTTAQATLRSCACSPLPRTRHSNHTPAAYHLPGLHRAGDDLFARSSCALAFAGLLVPPPAHARGDAGGAHGCRRGRTRSAALTSLFGTITIIRDAT